MSKRKPEYFDPKEIDEDVDNPVSRIPDNQFVSLDDVPERLLVKQLFTSANPLDAGLQAELNDVCRAVLSEIERTVLADRLFFEWTFKEIAKEYGLRDRWAAERVFDTAIRKLAEHTSYFKGLVEKSRTRRRDSK